MDAQRRGILKRAIGGPALATAAGLHSHFRAAFSANNLARNAEIETLYTASLHCG